jgi:hypothetical protein
MCRVVVAPPEVGDVFASGPAGIAAVLVLAVTLV